MSAAPTANDLVQMALAALQPRAAPVEPRPTDGLSGSAALQLGAFACIAAALGCALAALWICAAPILGAAGALLAVSASFCVIGLAAFVVRRRARLRHASPGPAGPTSDIDGDALRAAGSSLFRQRPVLALAAALLAGVFLARQS